MSNIKQTIDYAIKNQMTEMRDSLHAALTEKVALAIEEKKVAIAKGLLNQESNEEI